MTEQRTETHTVEFARAGETVRVSERETVLDACVEAGLAQEFSCRVGTCLACVARLVEGEVEQPGARGLSSEEGEEYVLTCVARPRADLVLERDAYPTTTSEALRAEKSDPEEA